MRRTPPIYTSGKYEARTPWVLSITVNYTATAIRSFKDMYERNIDVLNDIYIPKGLTKVEHDADNAEKATIVTLESKAGDIIYIPDTYILSYPNMANIIYNRVVISIDLGSLPDYKDLSALLTLLTSTTQQSIGVIPDAIVHVAQTADYISASQHDTLETAKAAVLIATGETPTTDKGRLNLANIKVAALEEKVGSYEELVIAAGLVT